MKFDAAYSHHCGDNACRSRKPYVRVTDIFAAPKSRNTVWATRTIRDYARHELEADSWAFGVSMDAEVGLNFFAQKRDLAVQLQTASISRYTYHLLKLRHLYQQPEIEAAILAVTNREDSRQRGSDLSYAERPGGL